MRKDKSKKGRFNFEFTINFTNFSGWLLILSGILSFFIILSFLRMDLNIEPKIFVQLLILIAVFITQGTILMGYRKYTECKNKENNVK